MMGFEKWFVESVWPGLFAAFILGWYARALPWQWLLSKWFPYSYSADHRMTRVVKVPICPDCLTDEPHVCPLYQDDAVLNEARKVAYRTPGFVIDRLRAIGTKETRDG